MPLDPLIDDSSLWTRVGRIVRIIPVLVFGAVTLIGFNLVQTLSLVLIPFSRPAFRSVNRWIAKTWWGWCVSASQRIIGSHIVVSGDDVPLAENALLLCNHQQMPDIVALMMLARSKERLGDLKFFVKDALKWVPGLGWGMQFLGCPYLKRDWTTDKEMIRRTFDTLVSERIPVWLVSFVEGTRSTRSKLAAAAQWAEANKLQATRHVMIPRSKGFVATIDGLRDHIEAVYDITIGYEEAVPTLWQYITGCVRRTHVHVRRFPIGSLPTTDADLRDWLFARFYEKDDRLERYYATGHFDDKLQVRG